MMITSIIEHFFNSECPQIIRLQQKRIEENRNGSHASKSSLQPKLLEMWTLIRPIH